LAFPKAGRAEELFGKGKQLNPAPRSTIRFRTRKATRARNDTFEIHRLKRFGGKQSTLLVGIGQQVRQAWHGKVARNPRKSPQFPSPFDVTMLGRLNQFPALSQAPYDARTNCSAFWVFARLFSLCETSPGISVPTSVKAI